MIDLLFPKVSDLVDIRTVKIDESLSNDEWYLELVRQIKNPFYYRYGKYFVDLKYDGLLPSYFELVQRLEQGEDFVQIVAEYIRQFNARGSSKNKNKRAAKKARRKYFRENIKFDNLVDASSIEIDESLSEAGRYLEFVRQTKNPFYYRFGNYIVELNYAEYMPSISNLVVRMGQGEEFMQIAADYIYYLVLIKKAINEDIHELKTFKGEIMNIDAFIKYSPKATCSESFRDKWYNSPPGHKDTVFFHKNVWQI